MADLVLENSVPYNIVKDKDGRWYFAGKFFEGFKNLPKDLRLVPESLIPKTTNPDGKTSYIPDSSVASYFKSAEFTSAFTAWNQGSSFPAYSNVTQPASFMGQQLPSAKPSGKVNYTAVDVARAVSEKVSTLDQQKRSDKFAGMTGKISTQTGKVVAPTNPLGSSTTDPATLANAKFADGTYKIMSDATGKLFMQTAAGQMSGAVEVLFVSDTSRKITPVNLDQFTNSFTTMPINDRKLWQQALGSKTLDGVIKPEELAVAIDLMRRVSNLNITGLRTEKNFQAVNPFDYAKQLLAEQKRIAAAQSGIGKTATATSTQATEFTKEWTNTVARQFFQEFLGKDPSAKDVAKFTKMLNARAQKNPATSTTKTTLLNAQGDTNRVTTSKEGFGQTEASDLLRQQAMSQTGVTGYQAATKYMDVLMSMVRNPVG